MISVTKIILIYQFLFFGFTHEVPSNEYLLDEPGYYIEEETVIKLSDLTLDNVYDYIKKFKDNVPNYPVYLQNGDIIVSIEKDGYYIKQDGQVIDINAYANTNAFR